MLITIVGFVCVLLFLCFLYLEFSGTLTAKRLRVTIAMWGCGTSIRNSWKYAKENVR